MRISLKWISVACVLVGAAAVVVTRLDRPAVRPVPVASGYSDGRASARAAARWDGVTDPSLDLNQRLEIVRGIDRDLPLPDVDHLFSLLRHQPASADRENWWMVANEIMECMRKHGAGETQYTRRLSGLIGDASGELVIRDYAIQHLGQWISPVKGDVSPSEKDAAECSRALGMIAVAIKDPSLLHTSVPGTGLLTLADASERLDDTMIAPVWEDLKPFLSGVIEGRTSAGKSIRTSAIQAVGRAGRSEFLPSIRALAGGEGEEMFIRLSSIHALGAYGQPEDEALLSSLAASGAVQYAARAALSVHQAGGR